MSTCEAWKKRKTSAVRNGMPHAHILLAIFESGITSGTSSSALDGASVRIDSIHAKPARGPAGQGVPRLPERRGGVCAWVGGAKNRCAGPTATAAPASQAPVSVGSLGFSTLFAHARQLL